MFHTYTPNAVFTLDVCIWQKPSALGDYYQRPATGWGTGLKMQTVRFFSVTLLGIHRRLEMYRGLVAFGSARWLIEILSAILRSTRRRVQSEERL